MVEQMGEYFVFVAKDTIMARRCGFGSEKRSRHSAARPTLRAFQKKVQVGQMIGANVIVKSGIREGDKIVVDGVQAIHDGSEINAF